MDDSRESHEQIVRAIYNYGAELMRNGHRGPQIESQLVAGGLDQQAAAIVVANLQRIRSDAVQSVAKQNVLFGTLWCIGDIVVMAVIYCAAASLGGETHVLASGVIAFGAIRLSRNLMHNGE